MLTDLYKSLFIFIVVSTAYADTLSIVAVGDIMMGSTYPDKRLPPEDGKYIFSKVDSILRSADLTIGNLEGPLLIGGTCTKTIEKGKCYAFRTPPEYGQYLADAGFDFMNCANNHANDFGADGVASTKKVLSDIGLKSGGPGSDIGEFEIAGHKVAVIPFSVSSGVCSIFEIEKAQVIVAQQARTHDIVIASFHGGGEGIKYLHTTDGFEYYMGWPRGNVVKFARAVVDSGADFVWGHGPHVPRAIEIYKDRIIVYSLGNFFTWGFNLDDERGYAPMLRIVLDSTGIFMHGKIISALQRTLQYPTIDSTCNAAKLIKRLSQEDFNDSAPIINETGEIQNKANK